MPHMSSMLGQDRYNPLSKFGNRPQGAPHSYGQASRHERPDASGHARDAHAGRTDGHSLPPPPKRLGGPQPFSHFSEALATRGAGAVAGAGPAIPDSAVSTPHSGTPPTPPPPPMPVPVAAWLQASQRSFGAASQLDAGFVRSSAWSELPAVPQLLPAQRAVQLSSCTPPMPFSASGGVSHLALQHGLCYAPAMQSARAALGDGCVRLDEVQSLSRRVGALAQRCKLSHALINSMEAGEAPLPQTHSLDRSQVLGSPLVARVAHTRERCRSHSPSRQQALDESLGSAPAMLRGTADHPRASQCPRAAFRARLADRVRLYEALGSSRESSHLEQFLDEISAGTRRPGAVSSRDTATASKLDAVVKGMPIPVAKPSSSRRSWCHRVDLHPPGPTCLPGDTSHAPSAHLPLERVPDHMPPSA